MRLRSLPFDGVVIIVFCAGQGGYGALVFLPRFIYSARHGRVTVRRNRLKHGPIDCIRSGTR